MKSGEEVIIHRPEHNSPNSITNFYDKEKSIECKVFSNQEENTTTIVSKIQFLIFEQKVKPTDILIIDINMNKSNILNMIQYELQQYQIASHIPGVVSDAREFFVDGHVTLTTPRNAKGNEVPIVFVIGCEDIYSKVSIDRQRQYRNFMFISITRSKGWVYLSAVGRVKGVFVDEYNKIQKNLPNIKFIYPNEEKIKELAKIDFLTNNPIAKKLDENMSTIKSALTSGNEALLKQLIDLDPSFKDSLKKLLEE